MVFQNNVLAGAAGSGTTTYAIDQSIRFNDNDSAYMYRTFGTATDQKTTTLSLWVKRCTLGTDQRIMVGATSAYSDSLYFRFNSNDTLEVINGPAAIYLKTTQIFRDTSAWYHIVFVLDTSNTISSERFRFYVNGQRITDVSAVYPSLNQTFKWNGPTGEHTIGTSLPSLGNYLDSYLAEIVFIDGQALDPSSFGEYNSSNIWVPKDVSGLTFGNNGFHLKGEDSADLGNDSSGNGNDFTVVNLAAHDQVSDSPTNNFCTYNSIQLQSGATLSNGNLDAVSSGSSWRNVHSTIGVSSGKWYWEVKADVINSSQTWIAGIQETSFESKANYWWQAGYTASSSGIVFGVLDSNYKVTNVTRTSFTHDIAQGDIVQFQLNLDDNELSVLVDGVSKGKIYDITANTEYTPAVCLYSTSSATINFGQDGTFGGTETAGGNSDGNGIGNFKYSVPSGYLALCTSNLGS